MAIDTSMYGNARPVDLMGGIQRGLQMRDQMDQRKLAEAERLKQQKINEAYQAGVVQNPDGSVTYDKNRTLMALAGAGGGKETFNLGENIYGQNIAEQKQRDALAQQEKENLFRQAQLDQQASYQNRQLDQNGQYQQAQIGKLRAETNELLRRPNDPSKMKLPLDQQKVVETLATKNANKISIRNQIDAVMSNWDKLSEDQKVATGRSLLKTLNSTEGADAIGAEEAKRLGSKLEFATGNLFNSNPIQFGRDLEGFATQARNASKGIGEAVGLNQDQIDTYMKRKSELNQRPGDRPAGKKPSWAL